MRGCEGPALLPDAAVVEADRIRSLMQGALKPKVHTWLHACRMVACMSLPGGSHGVIWPVCLAVFLGTDKKRVDKFCTSRFNAFVGHFLFQLFDFFVGQLRRAHFWATKNRFKTCRHFLSCFLSAPCLAKLTTEQNSSAFFVAIVCRV